jgi:hypothetical protein
MTNKGRLTGVDAVVAEATEWLDNPAAWALRWTPFSGGVLYWTRPQDGVAFGVTQDSRLVRIQKEGAWWVLACWRLKGPDSSPKWVKEAKAKTLAELKRQAQASKP